VLVERIAETLERNGIAYTRESDGAIAVAPSSPNGFEVRAREGEGGGMIWLGGWHEHFDDADLALKCFLWGLTDNCRLKVVFRGRYEYAWITQGKRADVWEDDQVVGLLLVPFWRRKSVKYFQNAYALPDR
jgi:hypothetical protein